jgi:hypothetical protein
MGDILAGRTRETKKRTQRVDSTERKALRTCGQGNVEKSFVREDDLCGERWKITEHLDTFRLVRRDGKRDAEMVTEEDEIAQW